MRSFVVVQTCFILFRIILSEKDSPEVKIEQGALRGTYRKTWKGRTFRAFTGIPYAKPPIGELRFEAPVPAEPWEGILDASKPHAICTQINVFFTNHPQPEGKEDCLYLNVYTPLKEDVKNQKLPVMVYIHGGGWTFGNGNTGAYGPDYLLQEDIVLVVINYRLGIIGFLSTEDDVAPGNYGLKDQVLALKWVQKNIHSFDGDQNKVTIAGQSAGGASVGLHLFSPLSKGLFHRAIAMSGSALGSWAIAKRGTKNANVKKLAGYLNCPITTSKDMVQCLKKADAHDIIVQEPNFYVISYHPFAPFMPVVEENHKGAFLTAYPLELINEGKINAVPYMTGTTTEDGAIISAGFYNDSAKISRLNREFDQLLPVLFSYEDSTFTISKLVRQHYFGDKEIDDDTKAELTKLFTDYYFVWPVDTAVRKIANLTKQATYHYLFGYKGRVSVTPLLGDPTHDYGVGHSDELYYLLSSDYYSLFEPNEAEKAMRDLMVSLWANFIKFGDPTPEKTKILPPIWNISNSDNGAYYYIKNAINVSMDINLLKDEMTFWKDVWHRNL